MGSMGIILDTEFLLHCKGTLLNRYAKSSINFNLISREIWHAYEQIALTIPFIDAFTATTLSFLTVLDLPDDFIFSIYIVIWILVT